MKKYLSRLLSVLLALVLLIAPASALTVDEALTLLEDVYYYDIPDEAYEAETLDELFAILGDPYTVYMSQEEYEAFLGALNGETNVVGIGVYIQYTEQGILVVEVIDNSSAYDIGLQAGDLIVEIEGESCVPANDENGARLTGEEGTRVSFTVLRDGERLEYTTTRRQLVFPTVEVEVLEGRVGYIACTVFGQETGVELAGMMEQYDKQVDRWILDLRGNPGGYTNAALDMLNALSGSNVYVYFQVRGGGVASETSIQARVTGKPVIVLTDGDSASSSELVAGNIQGMGRDILIGSRTFGKGVGQNMLDEDLYPDYFDGDSVKVTTVRFYSGTGVTTDKIGVIPTLLVDDAYTSAVAMALCGSDEDARLSVVLGGSACYVAPDTDGETLAALFAALPPQAQVFYRDKGAFDDTPISEAAEKMGVEYESRWFTDVADSPYADAINAMGTYELLNGTGGGKFSPDSKLTRAQLCVMLARVLNLDVSGGTSQFSDVPEDAWYAGEVNAVAKLGLVEGTGDGKFSPDKELTQEQFLTIMGRMAQFLNVVMDAYGQWVEDNPDQLTVAQSRMLEPYSDWARSSVAVLAWGVEDGLRGRGDMLYASLSKLSPKQDILRGEAAAGMYAVLSALGILL